jgi:hypothetical protein
MINLATGPDRLICKVTSPLYEVQTGYVTRRLTSNGYSRIILRRVKELEREAKRSLLRLRALPPHLYMAFMAWLSARELLYLM